MKILPRILRPAPAAIERRHAPSPSAYTASRSCLRWELGFTCAFCLVHEADLALRVVEGTALTGVEHHLTRNSAPERRDAYSNCFYSCRFCNDAAFAAVPHDAPAECRCDADDACQLPPHIESQCHDA